MNDIVNKNLVDPAVDASIRDQVVAVVGLGYVGLPLAVEFGRMFPHDRVRPFAEQDRAYRQRRGPDRRGSRASSSTPPST